MKCLVIAELDEGLLNRPSLATISAATNLSENIDLLTLDPQKKDELVKVEKIKNVQSVKIQ